MTLPWQCAALLVAAVTALGACSTNEAGSRVEPGVTRTPVPATPAATLEFDETELLQLAPGELRTVRITGRPPAPYQLSFSILGDAAGAWLDRTTVTADAQGRASVQLHASNLPGTFRLLATSKEGLFAEIGVAVGSRGLGRINAIPVYDGLREASRWTASVVVGATCAEISRTLPGELAGAIVAHAAHPGPVVVESVPVGPNLAVALRSGHAVWGCADETDLPAGSSRDVKVHVKDVPMNLAGTYLATTLTITSAEGVDVLLNAATARLLDSFLPEGAEAATLLDAMHAVAPDEQVAPFAVQRLSLGWDVEVETHLARLPRTVRDIVRGWAVAGLQRSSFELSGYLKAVGDAPGYALFEARELGQLPADGAGVPPAHQLTWTAEPQDVLRLGGKLFWMPSRYVGSAALRGVNAALPGASSVTEAIASAVDCASLGERLGGYAGCDAGCMAELCIAGLDARWRLGLDGSALAGLVGEIWLNASGPARVDEVAAPISWTADWVGTISDGESPAAVVQGEAVAELPAKDVPN